MKRNPILFCSEGGRKSCHYEALLHLSWCRPSIGLETDLRTALSHDRGSE